MDKSEFFCSLMNKLGKGKDVKLGLYSIKQFQLIGSDFIMALFTALSLLMTMNTPLLESWQSTGKVTEIFWNFKRSLSCKGSIIFIVWILLFIIYRNVHNKYQQSVYYPVLIINIILSVIWLMAEGYRIDNSLNTLTCSAGQCVKSIIYYLGTFWGLDVISSLLFFGLSKCKHRKNSIEGCLDKAVLIYNGQPFIIGVVIVFMTWLPHILVAYPGYFCYDAFEQLSQYFGYQGWNSHHPPFSTFIMGRITELGLLINDYLGTYLFILFQAVVAAMVISYGFCLLKKMKTSYWIRSVYVLSVIFVPYYANYVCVFLKDSLYSYSFLLVIIELIYLLIDKSEIALTKKRHLLLWTIGFSGLLLFRNNGIYVGLPLFLALILNVIYKLLRKQIDSNIAIRSIVVFTLPFIISVVIGTALNSHYSIQKGSIRETLSLPMQQTARYFKEYGAEVTEEERGIIQNVLPYEDLDELYDARISDPVKEKFKLNPTRKELIDYLTVWVKQFFKHPMVYINATLNQNYYCFYPFVSNDTCYVNTVTREYTWPEYNEVKSALKFKPFELLDPWKDRIYAFYQMCFEIPGLNLLSHPAFYNILLLWLCIFSIRKKLYSVLLTAIPLLLSVMIIILSPVIQGSPRYAFPIIYALPYILSYYVYASDE